MRIYTSASEPLDFCAFCKPSKAKAKVKYDNKGDGPDGRGNCFAYDDEHPDYEDGEFYCEICGKELTWRD